MNPMKRLGRALFGQWQWEPPAWAHWLGRHRLATLLGIWLIIAAVWGYHYYTNQPQPLRVTPVATTPGLSSVNGDNLAIAPLRITFAYSGDRQSDGMPLQPPSVARLDQIGGKLEQGIRLKPALAGTWRWEDDHTLLFEPAVDWPAATKYEVEIGPEILNGVLKYDRLQPAFTTPAFTASLEKFAFYLEPEDPTRRKVVATLRFSHAVDIQSLEQQLSLSMRPSGSGAETAPQKYGFHITTDTFKRHAYIHSDNLALPEQSTFMQLLLDKGLLSESGAAVSAQVEGRVEIPDRFSYLRVVESRSHIVRNAKDEPEQVLTLAFTDEINDTTIDGEVQAWLLPKQKNNRVWNSPAEINDAVLSQSTPVALSPIPNERDGSRIYNYRFDLDPNRDLYISLDGGIASRGGFVMKQGYAAVLRTPDYPKELKLSQDGSVLSRSGEHQIGFTSRGLDAVRVSLHKILDKQLHHLISQSYGDIRSPYFSNYQFSEENIASTSREILRLNNPHPKLANHAFIDLSSQLPKDDSYGLFLVSIEGWEPKRNYSLGYQDKRLILISDIGLIAKQNADKSLELFAQSLNRQEPLANARVELLGRNGLPVRSAITDSQGHAHLDSVKGLEDEQSPTVYLVRHDGDVSFLPFDTHGRQLNLSRFDIGGQYTRYNEANALTAYLFSDRGIYRPGDTANLGAIVRHADFALAGNVPLELVIRNPRGVEVVAQRLRLHDLGLFEHLFATEPSSETGTYTASLHLIRDQRYRGRQIGYVEFRVEEFQPDRMKIRSRLLDIATKGWSTADSVVAEVSLENLFGTPAQDRRIASRMTITPASFHFREFADYTFTDPFYDPDKARARIEEELPEARTDASGKARITIPLDRFSQGTYRLNLHLEGFEAAGGRSVSASNSVLLSPLPQLVGFKADGDLGYIHKDGARSINFIAIDNGLNPVDMDNLTLRLTERQPVSSLVRQDDGTFAYQTVIKERLISESPFSITRDGSHYTLPTADAGNFVVELFDNTGLKLSKVGYSVVGKGNLAGQLEKNAELQLKLNKGDYHPGETIEMSITAPYTGSGLITIESDRVHAWQWFRSETTASVQSITLPEAIEGNAYVQVAFVRAPDSREIFTSPLSVAVEPFTIDRSARNVAITLETPEKALPGEAMTIRYHTSQPGKVILFAVDEGILQVARYQTPQPLDHFLQKRALEVTTQQILDLLLPEYRLLRERAASGGGMADEMAKALGANLNPFARKVQKAVAFWSGVLPADTTSRDYTIELPETFNGRLRVMAVAVSDTAMGSAEKPVTVRGPFVLSPNLLTMAAPGDEFEVSVGIANNIEGAGKQAEVEVWYEAGNNLLAIGKDRVTLNIDEGSESVARFRLRAGDRPGGAEMRFFARHGEQTSRMSATLSIRPTQTYINTLVTGHSDAGSTELDVPRRLYPELAEQLLRASASPLVMLGGLQEYLDTFPHGCTEQVVSQVFPVIGLAQHETLANQEQSDIRLRVKLLIDRLRTRQQPDGGFSLWPGSRSSAGFPSLYAMHFLSEARQLGYSVPSDLFDRGLGYLQQLARQDISGIESARIRAHAIYLLTRNAVVTTNLLVDLQDRLEQQQARSWRSDISAIYMAASYRLLQKGDTANTLVKGYAWAGTGEGVSDYYAPLSRDAQYIYLVAQHFPDRLDALTDEIIPRLLKPVSEGRYTTISSAYTILALGAYGRQQNAQHGEDNITLFRLDGGAKQALDTVTRPFTQASFPTGVNKVGAEAGAPFFYQLSQSGFDLHAPTEPLRDKLEIERTFLNAAGEAVTSAKQGEELTVRLRLRSLDQAVDNVAVIDLLPGGFEIVRDSLSVNAGDATPDYVDVREDRTVIYSTIEPRLSEWHYKVKATATGKFAVPAAYAEAMYQRDYRARSLPGSFEVKTVK